MHDHGAKWGCPGFLKKQRAKFPAMNKGPFSSLPPLPKAFEDLQSKVSDLMKSAPAVEVEKHMKSALGSALSRMDLVTREDFEAQQQMLAKALEKLSTLEARLAELEKKPGQ